MKPIRIALDRRALWLDFARCYRQEAERDARRADYWLARAAAAELTATPACPH
ncbi:MAG: hypothetical protein ACRYFZ_09700 [Janthinobacterium lividum]